jgi:hypothetical protein
MASTVDRKALDVPGRRGRRPMRRDVRALPDAEPGALAGILAAFVNHYNAHR